MAAFPDTDAGAEFAWREVGRRGARAALQMTARSLTVRLLTFCGTLILARLLSPSDFGIFAIVGFLVVITGSFGDFGLGGALIQHADDPTPAELATTWTVQQAVALATLIVLWLAAPLLASLIPGLPGDAPAMIRVLALIVPLSSLRKLPNAMMERQLRFGPLAAAEIAQQAVYLVVAVGLALAGFRAWSMIVAVVVQIAVGTLIVNLAWRRWPTFGVNRKCLADLLGFGLNYQVGLMLLTLRDTPLPVLAGLVAGTASAGLLQFAMRLGMTIASLDEVISRIAFPAFSRLQRQPHQQARAADAAILLTALFMVPVQCWIAALAPVLVVVVFGSSWQPAVLPLQIICVGTLFRFPARYVREVVVATGYSGRGLGISALCLTLAIVPMIPGLLLAGLPGAGLAFLVGAAAGLVVSAWLARTFVRPAWGRFVRLIIIGLVAAGAALLALQVGEISSAGWLAGGSAAAHLVAAALGTMVFGVVFGGLVLALDASLVHLGLRAARQAFER